MDTRVDRTSPAETSRSDPQRREASVALVVDALHRNGATVVSLELVRQWGPAKSRLVVVQRLPEGAGMPVPTGVRVEHLQRRPRRLLADLPAVLLRLVRHARASDVVVGGSEIGVGLLLSYVAARLARRPFLVAVHADLDAALEEWISPRLHRLHHWVHRHADGAVSVAPALVPPLVEHGVDPAHVRVVRNGIDLAAVRRRAAEPPEAGTVDERTVVATGRLADQKGIDLLLRAHADVVRRQPHRVLLLNGGPDEQDLRRLAADLGVADTVEFLGAVRNPLAYVGRAGLFCLPSRHEGLPLALIEAVSLGAPCLAADCAEGVRDALGDGAVGALVPVDDVPALAAALEAHLTDPAPLRARAARGPDHARAFDSAVMAQGWSAAIAELVE